MELALTGKYSLAELADIANNDLHIHPKRKGSKMSKSSIHGILTNPFYYGIYYHSGKEWEGSHEPMITEEEFDQMQLILGAKGRARGTSKAINKYNGLFRCGECGYSVNPEPVKMKRIKPTGEAKFYKYWHCSHKSTTIKCRQKSITECDIEKKLGEILLSLEISDRFIKWGMLYISYLAENEVNVRNKISDNLEAEYREVMRKIDELGELYLDPDNADKSLLTKEDFKE